MRYREHGVRSLLVLIILPLFLFSWNVRCETAPPEAIWAAREGLPPFMNALPERQREGCGGAELGDPFRVYTITPAALDAYLVGDSVASLISPTGMWLFPVVAEGRSRFLLTVDTVDGSWRAVSLGQAGLAAELDRLLLRWPREKGYDPLLVSVFAASTHFFTIPQKDGRNLTPFVFGREGKERSGPNPYAETADLARAVPGLQAAVEANRSQP
jgi:hypothetical protein